jgi:diguanylate cyclase (GGDEF)-like protein/PAS domain S-box-containing protein
MNVPRAGGPARSVEALRRNACAVNREDRYRALIEASHGVVWRAAPDLACLETWGWDVATGQSQAQSMGEGWLEAVHPDDRERTVMVLAGARREGQAYEATYRARQADSNYRWVHCRCVPMRDSTGAITEWVGHLVDVHERIEADIALRSAEERLRLALEISSLVVWEYSIQSDMLWWSEGKRAVLGLPEDYKITPKAFLATLHPDDRGIIKRKIERAKASRNRGHFDAQLRMTRPDDGRLIWLASTGQVHFDAAGNPERILGTVRDVTAERASKQALHLLAHFDQLTGLSNRRHFATHLAEVLRNLRGGAIILLDLDGFKNANDTMGHHTGDLLLQAAASRLTSILPQGAFAARWGGDEFVIFVAGDDRTAVLGLIGKIEAAFNEPFKLLPRQIAISVSVGVAFIDESYISPDELIQQADLALYRAKDDGRGTSRIFSPAMRDEAQTRLDLESDLRRAFVSNELELHYQAQVDMSSSLIVGAEALLRWRHPERGMLTPSAFLDVLATSAIARSVGDWVLRTACSFAARCLRDGKPARMGVNIFSAQLRAGGLPEAVRECLREYRLPPYLLELEITENTILKGDRKTIEALAQLRDLGVGIAFDDYGTGYASLSMLTEYPLTRLKIDQHFVQRLRASGEQAVVKAIVDLGHAFGIRVTAEGIETVEQARIVKLLGCDEGQGFLYGRPIPPEDFLSQNRQPVVPESRDRSARDSAA